jgi:hypothetical protein
MIPEYSNEPFVQVTEMSGEMDFVPLAAFHEEDLFDSATTWEVITGKWFARLSAPGYLDNTDWGGPSDTEEEAREYMEEAFEVDPTTGESYE